MPIEQTYQVFALVLLLRVGQAMLLCGMVRSKNAASMAVRLLLDLALVTLGLWAIGAIFVPPIGEMRFLTFDHLFGIASTSSVSFQLLPTLLIASAAIYAAAAERTRFSTLLSLSALLAVLVVPLLSQLEARLAARWEVADSGVGIASIVGGVMGLIAAYFAGPRKNKFNRDQSVNFLPGHHVVFQVLGLLLVMASWTGMSGGPINLILGASAAAMVGAAYGRVRFRKIDTGLLILAVIGGLCATGVGAGTLPTWAAVLLGAAAGFVVPWAIILVETRIRIDDAAGLSVAYLGGGIIGWIGAAVLASNPYGTHSHMGLLCTHIGMLIASIVFAAATAVVVLMFFKQAGRLRVSETVEFDGADLSELDVNAYPDFQQNMIKSHHLREL